jgi:bacterioferritin-associated ferredoxin
LAKTIVCHCEDISLHELYSALEQGYNEIESIKRFTGIATGKCQGKCCVIQTLRVLDSAEGRRAIEAGASAGPGTPLSPPTDADVDGKIRIPTARQPVVPLKIDDIVDASEGGDER